jgi:hypothetical protein
MKYYNYKNHHNCSKHKIYNDGCCECRYGKLTILCEYNHKNKCELTKEGCKFRVEDRWLCDDFSEKGTINFDIDRGYEEDVDND